MQDSNNKLSPLTIALHWIVGLTILTLMAVGWYMEEFKAYGLYDIHKSIGIIILAFVLVRVIWRLKKGFPEPVSPVDHLQHMVAKLVHWVLLLGTLAFPISGMMMSGGGGHGLAVFGIQLLAENHDPITGKTIPLNENAAALGAEVHGILLWVLIVALVLHIGGALKHHLMDKDRTLLRMLGR